MQGSDGIELFDPLAVRYIPKNQNSVKDIIIGYVMDERPAIERTGATYRYAL